MFISFGWTWPALVAGHKTVTRRYWNPRHAAKFSAGQTVTAYDRSPRVRGTRIGVIRLTETPHLEPIANMPDSDYAAEGLEWLDQHPEHIPKGHRIDFNEWRESGETLYVVRFEVISTFPEAKARLRP